MLELRCVWIESDGGYESEYFKQTKCAYICWFCFYKKGTYEFVWHIKAGAEEKKDNLWGKTQEKVWNVRRLWIGRLIIGMVLRRLSHGE